jgi:hypothetical protein
MGRDHDEKGGRIDRPRNLDCPRVGERGPDERCTGSRMTGQAAERCPRNLAADTPETV